MTEGIIIKALSGFYYVAADGKIIDCKARGRFRLDGSSPLVGDRVRVSLDAHGKGRVDEVKERKNWFIRPAVANIDTLVFIAANTNPVTDPFLVDRFSVIAAEAGCELVVCVNKMDLIDFSEEKFRAIEARYREMAVKGGIRAQLHFLPISAKLGDNVVKDSENMPWHQGGTLMQLLENVPIRHK